MNQAYRKIRWQLVIGTVSTWFMLLFWRLAGPLLAASLSPSARQLVNAAAIYTLALPPVLVMLSASERPRDYGMTTAKPLRQLGAGIGIGLGMSAILTLIPLLLGMKDMVYTGKGYAGVLEAVWGLIYFVFVVGISEEFIFRGFLYSKLSHICLSDEMPVILSSALFGLYHLSGFNLAQVFLTGLIGAFFCLCRRKIPNCTVFSLALAHGIHDWLIRVLPNFF